jgi:putative hydrolase of the HAD superfamily
MPQVILFDLDDTLFAHRQSVDAAALAVVRELQVPRSGERETAEMEAEEVARWTALEEHHYTRYLNGDLDYLGQRRARARDFLVRFGVELVSDAEAESWFDHYLAHYRRAWNLYPDTMDVLHALADRRLGIITNGELDFQLAKISATGLGALFEHIVASGEVGVTKPAARIFEIACERFAVAPAEAVYIGDRLHTDAIGAIRAGLEGIWVDRFGASATELSEAAGAGVKVVRSLAELPPLLA